MRGSGGDWANLWPHPYCHWKFVPAEHEIDPTKTKNNPVLSMPCGVPQVELGPSGATGLYEIVGRRAGNVNPIFGIHPPARSFPGPAAHAASPSPEPPSLNASFRSAMALSRPSTASTG